MPGILSHALFADEIYRKLANEFFLSKIDFLSGNLIPDLTLNKNLTHYYVSTDIDGLFIPDIECAENELFIPENSIKLGMFCHIYLDYYFIKDLLLPKFIWDTKNDKVINRLNNNEWTIPEFFSQNGLYGFYTKSNQMILENQLISLITIASIPTILPNSGIYKFDLRRNQTWRAELNGYLSQNVDYAGEIFDIKFLWDFIDNMSTQFVQYFLSKNSDATQISFSSNFWQKQSI